MKAVYYLRGEPTGAEIHLTPNGLVLVGDVSWMKNVIDAKPPDMTDRDYLEFLM